MTALHPELLWLLLLAPVVWWIAQRRATRGTAIVPHLPVLESVLTSRDTSPAAPPWRAVALAAGCACAVLAAADLRSLEPAPRRMVVLWWGDALAGGVARDIAARALPGDDLHLLQAGPAGLRHDDPALPAVTDGRQPSGEAARAALEQVAGPAGVLVTTAVQRDGTEHQPLVFRLEPGPDGVTAQARWRGTSTRAFAPVFGRGTPGEADWEVTWIGRPIPAGSPLVADALLPAAPGRLTQTAVLIDVVSEVPLGPSAIATACLVPQPRPVLLVTDGRARPIERALVAALAAMPDLVSSAGRVALADLGAALRAQPNALLVGIGVGPGAAPNHDWLCVEPPAGDALLPLDSPSAQPYGVAERFSGAHPISRGLTAAGIEIDAVRPMSGSGPAGRRDARYAPLLMTDDGVAAVAGSPAGTTRVVALLGGTARAFAEFPAWPRFLRRSVAWIGDGRIDRAVEVQRAGTADVERPAGSDQAASLPSWRGRTRGAVRWSPTIVQPAGPHALVVEADPFLPPAPPAHSPDSLPPRDQRPTPGRPSPLAALAAAALLAMAVIRVPIGRASRA